MGVCLVDGRRRQDLRAWRQGQPFLVIQLHASKAAPQASAPVAASEKVDLTNEWVNLGLNLGGATLSWIGVAGSAALAPETVATTKALARAGSSWKVGLGALSRQQRAARTRELALQSARWVAARRINLVLQAKMLDAFAATYGTGISVYDGVAHDVVVWIVAAKGAGQ